MEQKKKEKKKGGVRYWSEQDLELESERQRMAEEETEATGDEEEQKIKAVSFKIIPPGWKICFSHLQRNSGQTDLRIFIISLNL